MVALDDGSTDETARLLESDPLVRTLLRNPRRETYAGWDDAANRNRLLDAAGKLRPEWIISLDADERIDETDAEALRAFVESDALPGLAYGFLWYPMRGHGSAFVDRPVWVYRLFAWEPGQRFSDRRLHFAPVPTTLVDRRQIRTTFRIQHYGSVDARHRWDRYRKYREADPNLEFWPDYGVVLDDADEADWRTWQPRSASTFVLPPAEDDTGAELVAGGLTIIVTDDGGSSAVGSAVDAARRAAGESGIEIVVVAAVAPPADLGSTARWITVPASASTGARRNAGLAAANEPHVLFLDPDLRLEPGAVDAYLRGHQDGYAMVAGAVELADETGWGGTAAAFLRFGGQLLPRSFGSSPKASRFCSYRRSLLLEVGGFPEKANGGEDVLINRRLAFLGYLTRREPAARVRYSPIDATAGSVLRQGFRRGRTAGRYFRDVYGERGHLLTHRFLRMRVVDALANQLDRIQRWNQSGGLGNDPRARILLGAAEIAGALGLLVELLRPTRLNVSVLFGGPVMTLLVIVDDPTMVSSRLFLVRADARERRLRAVELDLSTPVPTDAEETLSLIDAIRPAGDRALFSRHRSALRSSIALAVGIDIDEAVQVNDQALQALSGGLSLRQLVRFLGPRRSSAWFGSTFARLALTATLLPWLGAPAASLELVEPGEAHRSGRELKQLLGIPDRTPRVKGVDLLRGMGMA